MFGTDTSVRRVNEEVLEFVDDSEPEREEQRRNWRKGVSSNKENPISVIELTDSSDSDVPIPPRCTSTTNIRATTVVPSPPSRPAHQHCGTQNKDTAYPQESSSTLNLRQFAFQQPIPSASKVSSRVPSVKSGPLKSARLHSDNQNDISTSDVDILVSCVSCEVKWTSRKTSVQKLAHIRSCAKQRGLEVSTIKILIQRQAQKKPEVLRGTVHPVQSVLPSTAMAPRTLFENVAPVIQPKKRNPQKEQRTLLSTPRTGREAILSKAQAILGDPMPSAGYTVPWDGPIVDDVDGADSDSPQFGQSLLGQRLSSNRPGVTSKSYDTTAVLSATTDHQSNNDSTESELVNHFAVLDLGEGPSDMTGVAQETTQDQPVIHTPMRNRKSPAFDDKWLSHMRSCIERDETLHLRILRYEPIHFDVFVKIAESYAPHTNRLRREVRDFLDSQAIHFFGAENIWGKKQ